MGITGRPKTYIEANKLYGRLLAIKEIPERRGRGFVYWKCLCSCGKEVDVAASRLCCGHTSSCGCLLRDVTTARNRKTKGIQRKSIEDNAARRYFVRCKRASIARGWDFDLTQNGVKVLLFSKCVYCLADPSQIYETVCGKVLCNGIDRVNNKIGYTKLNSVSCCKMCNIAKNDLDILEWEQWLRRVSVKWKTSQAMACTGDRCELG